MLIFDFDRDQGNIIVKLQRDLFRISMAILLVSLLLGIVAVRFMSRKIELYLSAIKSISDGNYKNRLDPGRVYEFAKIAHEINQMAEKIEGSEEVRRRFVSDASHELKTPLASIKLLSDSITQNDNVDVETMREFVADIGNEAERLTRITEKLLALTRIDKDGNDVTINRTKVDMANVIDKTIKILKPVADVNNIKLRSVLEEDCFVHAVEDDIYQIALNLIENAIKYNNPNGNVVAKLKKTDSTVEMIVEDTGIGVPEDALPFLFDRFYRVDKARSREAGGSGLGLSIVKSTVEKYGGTVKAESRSSGGTRFIVTFKAAK